MLLPGPVHIRPNHLPYLDVAENPILSPPPHWLGHSKLAAMFCMVGMISIREWEKCATSKSRSVRSGRQSDAAGFPTESDSEGPAVAGAGGAAALATVSDRPTSRTMKRRWDSFKLANAEPTLS